MKSITTTVRNILINLGAIWLFTKLIGWLANYIPALGLYQAAPYYEQATVAFIFTVAFFVFVIRMKEKYNLTTANVTGWKKVLAYLFVLDDVYFNITFSPLFFLFQAANTYGEGWTFTAHCKAIKHYSEAKILSGKTLTPVEISRYWLCENLYGPIMNLGEKRHYS